MHSTTPYRKLTSKTQDAEYVVSEPQPNNVTQASGNLMIVETAGNACIVFKLHGCFLRHSFVSFSTENSVIF